MKTMDISIDQSNGYSFGSTIKASMPIRNPDCSELAISSDYACDVSHGDAVAARAIVTQQKTQRPVQFEITEQTRETVVEWMKRAGLRSDDFSKKKTRTPWPMPCETF